MENQFKRDAIVYYTDHFINKTITQFLAKTNKLELLNANSFELSDNFFISYGILRGNEDKFKKSENFIYIDHGFMGSSTRKFLQNKQTHIRNFNGYFRLIKNDFYFNKNFVNIDSKRFYNLKIPLKDLNKQGEFIILSEPSNYTLNFLNIPNWVQDTKKLIQTYSDREIIIHNKFSKTPLDQLLKKAFAFVSCQSTAGFKSIIQGVPSYFTHETMSKFGNINDIESRKLNHDLLYAGANSQWKLSEFFSDEFKLYFSRIINS